MARRIAVVGGTPIWRRGIGSVLADHGFTSAEFADLEAWRPGRGGAAVLLGGWNGSSAEAVRLFAEEYAQIPVIVVIPELSLGDYAAVVRAGAVAAISEHESPEGLAAVVSQALEGRTALPTWIMRAMATRIPATPDPEAWVSADEAGWVRMLAEGATVAEVADRAGYSEREMFRMLGDVYSRIGVRNRTEAIIWATRHGLLDPA